MKEIKVAKANITAMPKSLFDPMPKVIVTMDNGATHDLFEYYPDEISFTPSEFIGLTLDEARNLKRQKELKYLQS